MKKSTVNRFHAFIAARKLKISRQRIIILETFLIDGSLVTADEMFIKLRTLYPTIGRATVFRTMKLLAESGIARVRNTDGTTIRYDNFYFSEASNNR